MNDTDYIIHLEEILASYKERLVTLEKKIANNTTAPLKSIEEEIADLKSKISAVQGAINVFSGKKYYIELAGEITKGIISRGIPSTFYPGHFVEAHEALALSLDMALIAGYTDNEDDSLKALRELTHQYSKYVQKALNITDDQLDTKLFDNGNFGVKAEKLLRTATSVESRKTVQTLIALLGQLSAQQLTPENFELQMQEDRNLIHLIQSLEGKQLELGNKLVDFGQGNQIGDISIRDIIAGSVIHYHININQDIAQVDIEPKRSQT